MKSAVSWHKYSTAHVYDGQMRCISTDVGMHECAGCHGNSCSWYSAM